MQRRKFITAAAVASALPITATKTLASTPASPISHPVSGKGFIVKAGESRFGERTPFRGVNPNDLKVSSKDTGGALAIFEYVGKQKTGPSYHVHFDQDEIFYVLEGEYLFQIGDEKMTARSGDTIFGPRNVPHTWIQLSDTGKLVYQVQPAGKMEEFFSKMSQFKGQPTEEEIQKIHLEHGMKVLGPPLSLK
ncbi:cupin domain-containing protein [Spirosoma aerophilum]